MSCVGVLVGAAAAATTVLKKQNALVVREIDNENHDARLATLYEEELHYRGGRRKCICVCLCACTCVRLRVNVYIMYVHH